MAGNSSVALDAHVGKAKTVNAWRRTGAFGEKVSAFENRGGGVLKGK
jgi:hypothetical protein